MPDPLFRSDRLTITATTLGVTTADGLRLHGMRYRARYGDDAAVPAHVEPLMGGLLVLPDSGTTIGGLEPFILALMQTPGGPEKVVTFDRRGHGRSELGDVDAIGPEASANDILAVCDASGLHHTNAIAYGRAAFGLFATAPKRPSLLRRFVLNDGGPQFDGVGLARLSALLKRGRAPEDWADAAAVTRSITPGTFPALNEADWDRRARAVWRQEKKGFVPDVAPALAASFFEGREDETRPLWRELDILRKAPALLVRGETSPLMPEALAAKIRARHGDMAEIVAQGQGFIPSLDRPELSGPILDFLRG